MNRKPHRAPSPAISASTFQRKLQRLLGRTLARRWIAQLRRLGRMPADSTSAAARRRDA